MNFFWNILVFIFAHGNLYIVAISESGLFHSSVSSWLHLIISCFSSPKLGASATSGSSAGTTTTSGGAINGNHQDAARTQSVSPPATRGLATRTMVAAIPARSSVEAPNHVLSVVLPVQVRGQVALPNQSTSSQGSQTAVGNGAQPNVIPPVPQASVGGVAGAHPLVAQINALVANALAANAPGQVSSSAQSAADQGLHPTTNSRAPVLSSSTPTTTPQQNDLSG
jgi:hypothetical protein